MSHWTEVVGESEKVKAIFANTVPNLTSVDLHEIVLHRDGPRAILRFDFSTYPTLPPKKWQIQRFNKVQIQLMCVGLSAVSINGWKKTCTIDLTLQREDRGIRLTGSDGQVTIEIVADCVIVADISAYRASE